MAIGRIERSGGVYPVIQVPDSKQIQRTEPEIKTAGYKVSPGMEPEQEQAPVRKPVEPVEIGNLSLTFQKEDSFDYLGKDSALENLDIQKALTEMQRDQVLQEYQFFVGSSEYFSSTGNTQDGTVTIKK